MVNHNGQTPTTPGHVQQFRPHTAADVVTRPRLLRLLEYGASLTLVIAPAGYGKTTLIADWLETSGLPFAWVTFDTAVTDLNHFLTHILTALSASLPSSSDDALQSMLVARTLPPLDIIVEMLHEAVAALDQEIVLVLDDYHAVTAPRVHSLLADLLHLPPMPLRLVLASRHDPPLPLVSLRAHGQLVEIRSRDLSFTPAEAEQFLADSLEKPLSEQEIDDLVNVTEGWAASLRLAQLYLRQEQGFASLGQALEVGTRHARDFLAEEVFVRLPSPIQEFLMQSAILDRLSARVCAAVCGTDNVSAARANLHWLVANGVFTVPIDDAQEWFRCHALLRQFAVLQLQAHHGDAAVAALHRRASHWFAAAGYTEEAIRHALAANDLTDAVSILAQVRPVLMNATRWLELEHLLHFFSPRQIEADPELLLAEAWIARRQNTVAPLQASLQLAVNRLGALNGESVSDIAPGRMASIRGEVESLQAHLCYWRGDMPGVVAHSLRALTLLPHEARFVRAFAILFAVAGHHGCGDRTAALAVLEEYARALNPDDRVDQMYLLTSRASLHAIAGDLPALAAAADEMLQMSVGQPWSEPLGIAHYFRLAVHYFRNQLTDVKPLAVELPAHRYQSAPRYMVQAACFLALAYQAQGRAADANAVAAAELAHVKTNGPTEMLPYMYALQVDLALRQGDMEAAASLLREISQTPLLPTTTHYIPHLAIVRLYLQQNTPASLDMAQDLIEHLEQFWTTIGHAHILLELKVLKALYLQARGQEATALETLAQAARMAEPGGCIRIFADLGMKIDDLLTKLQRAGESPMLVAAVRSVIAAEAVNGATAPLVMLSKADDLAVLLSFREQEVLQLLGTHLTNKEIAAKLIISPQTVKRHLISIFRKLNVKSRRAAAVYACQLSPDGNNRDG